MPFVTIPPRFRLSPGFTLMEVMIAGLILAVGIVAAMGTIAQNNSFRKSLDENAVAGLVLQQMKTRLQNTPLGTLGHIYTTTATDTPPNQDQGWTLHLRATDAINVTPPAVSVVKADILNLPVDRINRPSGPFRPLTQQDLLDAKILNTVVGLKDLSVFIEYYNLRLTVGLTPGTMMPIQTGLVHEYVNQQDSLQGATPNASAIMLWKNLVGDPNYNLLNPSNPTPDLTTYSTMKSLILPAIFDTSVTNPSKQLLAARDNGVVIRILISWTPHEVATVPNPPRRWQETLLVKRT